MSDWRPMAEARKDGSRMLLYGQEHGRRIWGQGYYYFTGVSGDGEGWIAFAFHAEPHDDFRGSFTPTHWQPLPAPPQEDRT